MATVNWNAARDRWAGIFKDALLKVQKQVHPDMDLAPSAASQLDTLLFNLFVHLCAQQDEVPMSCAECEQCVKKLFPSESAALATWAISEASQAVERASTGRRRSTIVNATEFPVEKVHQRLMKDGSKGKSIKIDLEVVIYLLAVLDYIAADILKLVGEYVMRCGTSTAIQWVDILTAVTGDKALDALIKPLGSLPTPRTDTDMGTAPDLAYQDTMKEMMLAETEHQAKLEMLSKVFLDYFENNSSISEDVTATLFGNIKSVVEISQGLQSLLEESLSLAESRNDLRYPPIGACFLSFVVDGELDAYKEYAENYESAIQSLNSLLEHQRLKDHFEQDDMLLGVQHVLPDLILEPVLHLRYYFELLALLIRITPPEEPDVERLRQAVSALSYAERSVSPLRIPRLSEDKNLNQMPYYTSFRVSFRVEKLQKNIGDWEGADLAGSVKKIIRSALDLKIWNVKSRKSTIRKVWIFDTTAIFCKTADKKGYQYRLKERFDSRNASVSKAIDCDDYVNGIRIVAEEGEDLVIVCESASERDDLHGALLYWKTDCHLQQVLRRKIADYERDLPSLMPSASAYMFSEPDSSRNLRFENESGSSDVIKGGTVLKLVERLTYPRHADMNYVKHFLISFRSFCSPGELLDMLIRRYKIPLPNTPDKTKVRHFTRKISGPIKLRVVNVLKQWIDKHYTDFVNDGSLLKKLLQFIKDELSTDGSMKSKVALLTKSIRKQRELSDQPHEISNASNPPPAIIWPQYPSDTLHILTLHPVEVARQITKLESELYRSIKASELTGQGWTKADKLDRAPNVLNMSGRFNQVSHWVSRTILEMNNFTERVECVSLFLDILKELRDLQNYNGVMEVLTGLEMSAVKRLKHTWAEVAPKRMKIMEECAELVSPDKNFTNLRQKLSQLHPPCVPFFGMYLTQILHVEEGSPDFLPLNPTGDKADAASVILSELVNFGKRRLVAKIILEIQQYQNEPYNLSDEHEIRLFLLDFPGLDDLLAPPPADATKKEEEAHQEALYQKSLLLEPRSAEDKSMLEQHDPVFASSARGRKDLLIKIIKGTTSQGGMRARLGSLSGSSQGRVTSGAAPSSGIARTYSSSSNGERIHRSNSTASRSSDGNSRSNSATGFDLAAARSRRSVSMHSAGRNVSGQSTSGGDGDSPPKLPPRRASAASSGAPPLPPRRPSAASTSSHHSAH